MITVTEAQETYLKACNTLNYDDLLHRFSCLEVRHANAKYGNKLRYLYREVMGFEPYGIYHDYMLYTVEHSQDPHELRIWLLCMMAACCGDFLDMIE